MSDFLVGFGMTDWVSDLRRRVEGKDRGLRLRHCERGGIACLAVFDAECDIWNGDLSGHQDGWIAWVGDPRSIEGSIDEPGTSDPKRVTESFLEGRHRSEHPLCRCHGPVALVQWHADRLQLECARDKLGEVVTGFRPEEGGVLVSSNLHWLHRLSEAEPACNRDRLLDHLWNRGGGRGRADFVEGLRRIRPGEVATWNRDLDVHFTNYWEPKFQPITEAPPRRLLEVLEEVIASLDVENSLVSMSGGVDSLLLAALVHARSNGGPIPVVSQVAPGLPPVDESREISQAEEALPVRVHRYDVTDAWQFDRLDRLREWAATGPPWLGGEVFNQPFRDWAFDRFDRSILVDGSLVEWGLAPYGVEGLLLEALRTGGLEEWLRYMEGREPVDGVKVGAKILLEAVGARRPVMRFYRGIRARNAESNVPIWERRESWLRRHPSELSDERYDVLFSGARSYARYRFRFLRTWRWEETMRTRERQMRLAGHRLVAPFGDDRVLSLLLRMPPRWCVGKRVVREAAKYLLPVELADRRSTQHFTPLSSAGLTERRAVRWVLDSFDAARTERLGLVESDRFVDAFLAFVRAFRRCGPSNPDQPNVARPRRTLAGETWLRWLDGEISPAIEGFQPVGDPQG